MGLFDSQEEMNKTSAEQNGETKKVDFNNFSSTAKLAVDPEEGLDDYDPWQNRDLAKPLGTMGALFHMIKSSLGTGVLAMPAAFKNGGLWASLIGTMIGGVIYIHCIHILMYSCHALCKRLKKPRLDFAEIAEYAFLTGSPSVRRYTAFAKEFIDYGLLIGYQLSCVIYVVFAASSIKQIVEMHYDIEIDVRIYSVLLTVIVVPLGLIKNLKYLLPFSFCGICALTFGCGFVLYDVLQDLPPISSRPAITDYRHIPLLFPAILYAFEGIGTVLPIENTMSHPQNFLGYRGVVSMSMVFLASLCCVMGFFGFLKYGEATESSITLNITSSAMGQAVSIMVTLNVLCSYGLFLYVPVEIIWRKLEHKVSESKKTFYYYFMRILVVLSTVVVASAVPDLGPFMGLAGAIGSSTYVLFYPPVLELVTFWEDKVYMCRWRRYKNYTILLIWLVTLVTGTDVAMTGIIAFYS